MTDRTSSQFGDALRRHRLAAGLSIRQLTDQTGISSSTIGRLELGEVEPPRPEQLQRLARALGIDVEVLYGEAGYFVPEGLPELAPYLRTKYGLPDQAVAALDEYFQAMRSRWEQPAKEGGHDQGDNNNT